MSSDERIQQRTAATPGLIADRSSDIAFAQRGMQRMGLLLDRLGQPQLDYRTIHVAGSKGKGTTTHLADALLREHGYRTGRYTSPHLRTWNERLAIDGEHIDEEAFTQILATIEDQMTALEQSSARSGSFNAFELLTAAAFVWFREQQCDIAVIEVGLGGRFDSTNHLRPVATVITRIEDEHLDVLGPTLAEVAWNKAGTIRPRVPVVVANQRIVVNAAIEAEAESHGAPLFREGIEWQTHPEGEGLRVSIGTQDWQVPDFPLAGPHNRSNLGAAVVATHLALAPEMLDQPSVGRAVGGITIPGRFDIRHYAGADRYLVLDVAHTPESIQALLASARSVLGMAEFEIVLGLLADKPIGAILETVQGHGGRLLLPHMSHPRAHSPRAVADVATTYGLRTTLFPDVDAAIESLAHDATPVVVTGSFGIVSEALAYLARSEAGIA